MKYVLDSSVALKWVLPEADSAKATRLRDEYLNGTHELIAPDIFTPEIANGLASAERQRRIKSGESAVFLNDILRAAPVLVSRRAAVAPCDGRLDCHAARRIRLHLPRARRGRGV